MHRHAESNDPVERAKIYASVNGAPGTWTASFCGQLVEHGTLTTDDTLVTCPVCLDFMVRGVERALVEPKGGGPV